MKRVFLLLTVIALNVCCVMAIPAHKAAVKVQQPDGTNITIRLHGDEWRSFNTTDDGYSVVQDSRGYYVYADLKDGILVPTAQIAHDLAERSASEQAFLSGVKKMLVPEMTAEMTEMNALVQQRQKETLKSRRAANYDYNNFRGLLILIEYNDKSFSRSDYKELLTNMVNKEGYTGYDNQSYTGSVRDYFSDNSLGKFKPEFDVYGPYKVDYSQTDPKGTSGCRKIINAVLDAADADINYADYDRDGDGVVDMVFFIVPGCGANYSGNNSRYWWPHRSIIRSTSGEVVTKDGVAFEDYASSVEMYGWERLLLGGHTIAGIGTICHEFSHVLGLPDFYDSDYSAGGGQSNDPGDWSVMAEGSDGDKGRTPIGYSLYERWLVGFIDQPEKIEAEGSYSLEDVSKEGKGYMIETPVADEFFLLENRQKGKDYKWNEYVPGSGLLVHRVDRTDLTVWSKNKVNSNPNHNYYEIVRAGGTSPSSRMGTAYDVFPGTANVTKLNNETTPANLKTWEGEECPWGLSDIKMNTSSRLITFNISSTSTPSAVKLPTANTTGNLLHPSYNMQGQRVGNDYKGLVVREGKKLIQK